MSDFKSSTKQKNKTDTLVQSPEEGLSQGEMEYIDSRVSTFQLVQLQAAADDHGNRNRITQLQSKATLLTSSSKIAQLQAKSYSRMSSKQSPIVQREENKTGLPDDLKSGMESISGVSLNDVKVHRNSDKPAQLQAHAFAQGTDIHLGPGQDKHLPHELGHIVQQKEGRVKPTLQLKGKININDDASLEKEADLMGNKALTLTNSHSEIAQGNSSEGNFSGSKQIQRKEVIQRQRSPQEEAAAREVFKAHFIEMFKDVNWLTYGGAARKVEDTALLVYDKLVATLVVTKPAMDQVRSAAGRPSWDKELATKGDRYKESSSGVKEVATGATPEFKAALKLAESFANELKDLTKQSKTAKKLAANGFAFWSGNPAKVAAKNSGLASLEGSTLGGIFDDTQIPEGVDMSIWGSISKAYAEWATEETAGKKYHGYVGLGGDRLDSVYNSVEKWAVEMSTAGNANFRVNWFPVIPELDAYKEAAAVNDWGKIPRDRYKSGSVTSGGSDITSKGLTSRAEAEQKVREEDSKRKGDLRTP